MKKVSILCSRRDNGYRDDLFEALSPLKRDGSISLSDVPTIADLDVLYVLASNSFLADDALVSLVNQALDRGPSLRVIPVMVRACNLGEDFPRLGGTMGWLDSAAIKDNRDKVFSRIAAALRELIRREEEEKHWL